MRTYLSKLLHGYLFGEGVRPDGSPDKGGTPWYRPEFADKAGIQHDTLNRYLLGTRRPRSTIALERALFGDGPQWDSHRREFREVYAASAPRSRASSRISCDEGIAIPNSPVAAPAEPSRETVVRLILPRRVVHVGRCAVCSTSYDLHLHHRVPIWHGGSPSAENLLLLCEPCHRQKHRSAA
jgi:hypothetical protein